MKEPDMQVRLVWKDEHPRSQTSRAGAAEWLFLLAGLAAVDVFVWVNTSTVLYQAYEDWAFDQTMLRVEANRQGLCRGRGFLALRKPQQGGGPGARSET